MSFVNVKFDNEMPFDIMWLDVQIFISYLVGFFFCYSVSRACISIKNLKKTKQQAILNSYVIFFLPVIIQAGWFIEVKTHFSLALQERLQNLWKK